MAKQFDYQGAKAAGYSDEEISGFLAEHHPKFDFQDAQEAGYSPAEINEFLSSYQPKRSALEKGGRIARQVGLGAAEKALMPYEFGVAPLSSKKAQQVPYRENLFADIERLQEQKASGQWDQQDQQLYDSLLDQIRNPEKAEEFIKTADIGVRGIAEKATGQDLHPEGVLEKAANWMGFLIEPKKILSLAKTGLKPKEVVKAISPTGQETLRSLGAGFGLQMAEEGKLGPIGTMIAAVLGDLAGGGSKGAIKALLTPKQSIAKVASKFTPKEKLDLQKEIIKDFRDAGIQADLGTITDSNIIKSAQARLAASGLTGDAFDKLKKQITDEIKEGYKKIADELGESRFASQHEASEIGKEALTEIRNAEKSRISEIYTKARESLKEDAKVSPVKLASTIEKIRFDLAPGAVKSTEQKAVLDVLDKLKADLYDVEGNLKAASVKDLMNNKAALNDIINYEMQGGQKQLLKQVVAELDKAIVSHGAANKEFLKNYAKANKEFTEHARTFRNENVNKILTSHDPQTLINKMNNVQGIKDMRKAFYKSPEGKKVFDDLARLKLDQIIEKNMVDGTTNQVKLGTFSNLLKKGKNEEIVKELLSPEAYKRLVKLQKSAGRLAESAQKFYNASKSGTVVLDAGIIEKLVHTLYGLPALLSGNIWMLAPYGGYAATRYMNRLITDPKFLKAVEDMMLATEKNNVSLIQKAAENLAIPVMAAIDQERPRD